MVINLRKVFNVPGEILPIDVSVALADITDIHGYDFASPVVIRGQAFNRAGIVKLKFTTEFTLKLICDRCLEEFERSYVYDFEHVVVKSLASDNVEYIVEKAYDRGMKIIFNPAPFNDVAAKISLSKLYCIIPNETECSGYVGSENYKAFAGFIREKYPDLKAVITLGKDGCAYIDKDNEIIQPAYSVKAVDTTAAGDTFVGYFVAEMSRGKDPRDAIRTACAASAITVSRKGAAPSIPEYDEVIAFLNK